MEQHMMGYQRNHLDHAKQYLTFTLGGEEYGIEILNVHEIKAYGTVTPLPNTPAHIKGVMNLRGMIMPEVDLLTIGRAAIQAAPDFGVQVDLRFIAGLTKAGETVVILLDLERLLSEEELAMTEPSRPETTVQAA